MLTWAPICRTRRDIVLFRKPRRQLNTLPLLLILLLLVWKSGHFPLFTLKLMLLLAFLSYWLLGGLLRQHSSSGGGSRPMSCPLFNVFFTDSILKIKWELNGLTAQLVIIDEFLIHLDQLLQIILLVLIRIFDRSECPVVLPFEYRDLSFWWAFDNIHWGNQLAFLQWREFRALLGHYCIGLVAQIWGHGLVGTMEPV